MFKLEAQSSICKTEFLVFIKATSDNLHINVVMI